MSDSHSLKAKAYWKENIRLVLSLLGVWFLVSFGMAILFVNILDNIHFFGFKFGFWMAQQGSIYCFVILIFAKSLRVALALQTDIFNIDCCSQCIFHKDACH